MSDQLLSFTRRGISPENKLILLALLSLILLTLDGRYAAMQNLKRYTAVPLYPLQWLANKPAEWYENIRNLTQSQTILITENQKLAAENASLQLELRHREIQARELSELKSLLQLKSQGLPSGTAAEIIANGRGLNGNRLVIDKGSRQQVQAGDAVVDGNGLIGQVNQVNHFTAEINLITDSHIVIPVMVARTGVRTLLYGNSGSIALRYFPSEADLQSGDILITSGFDSIYPAGIPVASVVKASQHAGTPYYNADVKPVAQLHSARYVFVLPQISKPHIGDAP